MDPFPPSVPDRDVLFLGSDVLLAAALRADAGVRRLWELSRDEVGLLSSPRTIQEARLSLLGIAQPTLELDALVDQLDAVVPDLDRRTLNQDIEQPDWLLYLGPAFAAGATHVISTLRALEAARDLVYGGHVVVMSPAQYLARPPRSPRFVLRPTSPAKRGRAARR